MRWFTTFEQAGMLLEILGLAYVSNELYERFKPLYTEQQKIFLKKILLIY